MSEEIPDSSGYLSAGEIIAKVETSVVHLKTDKGLGTGFFLDTNGIIVTNRHVIDDTDDLEIMFKDSRTSKGRILYIDPKIDVAFIGSEEKASRPLKPSSDDMARQGCTVIAIGHPLGLEFSATRGIISALARDIEGCSYLQTDVSINPGNSGGPLVDERGDVVGMCTLGLSGYPGLNFAIPTEEIRKRYRLLMAMLRKDEKIEAECPGCNYRNHISSRYCNNCGARLAHLLTDDHSLSDNKVSDFDTTLRGSNSDLDNTLFDVCPSCGTGNDSMVKYCLNCGLLLVKEENNG